MKNKKQEGITLISLAITIIVLLILAGITLNLTLGENGIFKTATDAKEKHKIGELTEKLELQKVPVQTENKGKVTLETYLEQIVKEGIIDESDIQETGEENSRTIIVEDKYVFLVEDEENGDVKITYQGEAGKLLPVLEIEKIETTTSTIKIKVTAKRLNDGEYKYYIKDIETGEEYKLEGTNKTGEYTFEGLTQEHEYQIKIEAINKNGTTSIETGIITTTEVEGLTQANTTFTYNPEGWTNKNVVVTANTTISIPEGYKLQTSKNASDWSDTTSQTFTENGTMYVRLSDGTNGGSYAVAQVSKIDKTAPEVEAITTTKSITITAADEASGIIGYKITTNSTQPTEFTSCTNTKNLNVTIDNLTQGTTYYVWVKDEAGNINTQKQFTTKLVDELTQANTTFTYNPEGWTNKDVVVTANTTISIPEGYKLQTSKDASNWNDIASQTFTENGTMYVRLFDGINGGNYAVAQVSKIDKDIPIVTEVTSTTNSVTIKATDSASGIIGYAVTTNNTQPTEFTSCANTKNLNVTIDNLTQGTTYYVWVKDEAENINAQKQFTTKQQLVTTITLNKSEITLEVNKTETLKAIIEPSDAYNKNLKWSTTNENIITVSNGKVTAVNPGTATITAEATDGSGVKATCTVNVEQQRLKTVAEPGDYVKYDTGITSVGENGVVTFRVLYNDDTYGLQIISHRNVEKVTLGGSTWEEARDSYNNVITILNQKAENYATNSPYALDGRCVGSVPTIGADGKFNAKNTENVGPVQLQFTSEAEGANEMKEADENYTTDQTAMQAANIWRTGEGYLLASRYWIGGSGTSNNLWYFSVRCVNTSNALRYNYLCLLRTDGFAAVNEFQYGLRPCISLKSDVKVIAGDGQSSSTAYELEM